MFNARRFVLLLLSFISSSIYAQEQCGDKGVWLQVLGSGGPEATDQRASSAYLIWYEGKAKFLIDSGAGSLLRFEQSGASFADIDVVLLSHLHVDHSSDLPAFLKASFFTHRKHDLLLYGPSSNHLMPSTTAFVDRLFGPKGAYPYLKGYLNGSESYQLLPDDVDVAIHKPQLVISQQDYQVAALSVHHGPIPALAWRVSIGGKTVVFSGDMNNSNETLANFAQHADILLAHNAVPETAKGVARNLHMPPSVIASISAKAKPSLVVLSHRMRRTLGGEAHTLEHIEATYTGQIRFANDLQCFEL